MTRERTAGSRLGLMYITGFFHVIGSLLRKPGSFTIYFSTIQFSSFFFFSPVSLKQSPAATVAAAGAAAMQWPEDATRVSEASKAWADTKTAAAGGGGMRRRPEWSDEEMMMTREIFLLNMTPWHFRRKMENFQRTTITIGWTGVACRRRPSRRISVVCSGARRGVAWRRWQPVEPKINFINRGSPHLIHQNEVTQIRVRKRVTVNCAAIVYTYACSVGGGTPIMPLPPLPRRTGWYSWKEGQEHTTEWISFRLTFKKVVCQFPMIENDFSFSHNTIFVKAKLAM